MIKSSLKSLLVGAAIALSAETRCEIIVPADSPAMTSQSDVTLVGRVVSGGIDEAHRQSALQVVVVRGIKGDSTSPGQEIAIVQDGWKDVPSNDATAIFFLKQDGKNAFLAVDAMHPFLPALASIRDYPAASDPSTRLAYELAAQVECDPLQLVRSRFPGKAMSREEIRDIALDMDFDAFQQLTGLPLATTKAILDQAVSANSSDTRTQLLRAAVMLRFDYQSAIVRVESTLMSTDTTFDDAAEIVARAYSSSAPRWSDADPSIAKRLLQSPKASVRKAAAQVLQQISQQRAHPHRDRDPVTGEYFPHPSRTE